MTNELNEYTRHPKTLEHKKLLEDKSLEELEVLQEENKPKGFLDRMNFLYFSERKYKDSAISRKMDEIRGHFWVRGYGFFPIQTM